MRYVVATFHSIFRLEKSGLRKLSQRRNVQYLGHATQAFAAWNFLSDNFTITAPNHPGIGCQSFMAVSKLYPKERRVSGFSLLEVVIAISIFAVGLLALAALLAQLGGNSTK